MTYKTIVNAQSRNNETNKQASAAAANRRADSKIPGADIEKIVHDARSSLNIIIGYSELMLDDVLGKMNEEQRDSIKDILKNSENLLDLINDIALWRGQPPRPNK